MSSRARLLILIVAVFVLAIALLPRIQTGKASGEEGSFELQKPSFIEATNAEEAMATGFPEDEVGIAAYFKCDISIDLNLVRDEYRTRETETASYIIGSIAIPNYGEMEDAHVYVHVDGWAVAYYLYTDPVSKIVDLYNYDAVTIYDSKLEQALDIIAGAAGCFIDQVKYYDFRYPNSTHMTIVAERNEGGATGGTFEMNLTDQYVYSEESWAIIRYNSASSVGFQLDGASYASCNYYCYGEFTPDLSENKLYTFKAGQGLAVVLEYRVP